MRNLQALFYKAFRSLSQKNAQFFADISGKYIITDLRIKIKKIRKEGKHISSMKSKYTKRFCEKCRNSMKNVGASGAIPAPSDRIIAPSLMGDYSG